MWLVFWWIWKIVTEVEQIDYDIIQPYLVWRVKNEWNDEFAHPYRNQDMVGVGENYPLIAPSEMAYSRRWDELIKLANKELPAGYDIVNIKLLCGKKEESNFVEQEKDYEINGGKEKFDIKELEVFQIGFKWDKIINLFFYWFI